MGSAVVSAVGSDVGPTVGSVVGSSVGSVVGPSVGSEVGGGVVSVGGSVVEEAGGSDPPPIQSAAMPVELVQSPGTSAGPPAVKVIAAHCDIVNSDIGVPLKTNLIQNSIWAMLDYLKHSILSNPL